MNKVLSILEKNVEWFALGLGGLWVLWVLWTAVLQSPVFVVIGGKQLGPGEVDQFTHETVRTRLEQEMANPRDRVPPVAPFASLFENALLKGGSTPAAGSALAWGSAPAEKLRIEDQGPRRDAAVVLPKVPPLKLDGVVTGRSLVLMPPDPKLVGAAPPMPVAGEQVDKDWATIFASFDNAAWARNLQQANVPPELQQLGYTFLSVQLERQEKLPDGTWGKTVKVPPLKHLRADVTAVGLGALTARFVDEIDLNKLPEADRVVYVDWAKQNQTLILNPVFYQVVGGDAWRTPQSPAVAPAGPVAEQWTPEAAYQYEQTLPPGERYKYRMSLTAEQRQELHRYEQQLKARETPPGRPPGTPPRTGRPGRPGAGEYDVQDPRRLAEMYAQARPPAPRRPWSEDELMSDDPRLLGRGTRPPRGQPAIPNLGDIPGAAGLGGAQPVWAHDETMDPGKTYRYRIRVQMYNPLWNSNVPADKDLARIFALPHVGEEAWSEWTEPVTIPPRSRFFVISPPSIIRPNEVRVAVTRWQNGQNHEAQFVVTPGDAVGQVRSDVAGTIDFTTGWTLVDVRKRGSDFDAILVDPEGTLQVRSINRDQREYNALRALPAPAPSAPGAAAAAR